MAIALLIFALSVSAGQGTRQPLNNSGNVSPDEYSVYAAAIDGLFKNHQDRKVYISGQTLSYECGDNSCNPFKIGNGCNGMRTPDQSVAQASAYLKNAFSSLEQSTVNDFGVKNQHCSSLENLFPLERDYLWQERDGSFKVGKKKPSNEIPEDWKASDLVYLSRVGFNLQKRQAILYWAVICQEECGWFGYYYLEKKNGNWTVISNYQIGGR